MRERLRRSARPDRVFEVTLDAARQAGLVGRRRVLDSTPLYDAVATMDTVTLVRSAIRGVLKAAGSELAGPLRGMLARDDDYAAAGKPACDYDDAAARGGTGRCAGPRRPGAAGGPGRAEAAPRAAPGAGPPR